MTTLDNVVYDEIELGQTAQCVRTLTQADIQAFAAVSGDINPAHLDAVYASHTPFHGIIGHGMWSGALISSLLGTIFPGPGTIYVEQSLQFKRPVRVGDTLTTRVKVTDKEDARKLLTLACDIYNQDHVLVVTGVARVIAPTEKLHLERLSAPSIRVFDPARRLHELLAVGQGLSPVPCAVIYPCDVASLRGALDAAAHAVIEPVLFGPDTAMRAIAEHAGLDISGLKIIDVATPQLAAEYAVRWAVEKRVEVLLQGSLTVAQLRCAVEAQPALRTKRKMSHLCRLDVPLDVLSHDRPLFVSDTVWNTHPTLADKLDIVQNAIDATTIWGVSSPKVAILSATEKVNSVFASTLDAAALCKMAERGQISGGFVDGPLGFDEAVSPEAAKKKNLRSLVAGHADILIVPDLESGVMLVNELGCLQEALRADVVLGARVPIIFGGHDDGSQAWVVSSLLAKLLAHRYRQVRP